ncbi:acetyltransferase [Pectobacterium actinidiae]|uniref:acetyltransferase n=1 Tax=Pectobacterium actinidiae TaxID=1507808 RepID=UPI002A7EAAFA|nr:acetyltransferase [Pectobacterium actinidiae]MDY4315403.1 acetyltransferase [Pectobacterium actinidiae]
MKNKMLAIYGSGGLGREFFDIANAINIKSKSWSEIVFINDYENNGENLGAKVFSFDSIMKNKDAYEVIIAIGEPSLREKLFNKAKSNGLNIATLIDPTARVSPTAIMGEGCVLCEYSSIHCNVNIGNNCLIQPYSLLGHDIVVGSHSVFSAHSAPGGSSVFGDRVYVGMHATIKEKITVGDDAIISMGAAVFRDVAACSVVIGNPARVTKGNDEGKVFL